MRKPSLQPSKHKNTHVDIQDGIERLPRLRRHTPDRWDMPVHILPFITMAVASNINYLLLWGEVLQKEEGPLIFNEIFWSIRSLNKEDNSFYIHKRGSGSRGIMS